MSEIKLYKITGFSAVELPGKTVGLEKSLQSVIEKNLEDMLGVRFLQSEYPTDKSYAGRIDTLGIDEDGCPTIIEYKRSINENVMNQGLFYLDWLMTHRGDFQLLVMKMLGKKEADEIDWTGPRLLCIASDFTKYDEHAVKQIDRNIDLLRYRQFGRDLLALELVYRTESGTGASKTGGGKGGGDKSVAQWLKKLDRPMLDLLEEIRSFILALGNDVSEKKLKLYVAFRRIKNFACIVIKKEGFRVLVKLNPRTVKLEKGFTRDIRKIGHWGTGNLEITIANAKDLQKAQPLLQRSYDEA